MHIRVAEATDAPAILAVQRAAYHDVAAQYRAPDLPPLVESLGDVAAAIGTQAVLVAETDDDAGPVVVGSVRARVDGSVAHIARLSVRPDLHGRGVGRRLLDAIERHVAPVERYELFTGHRSDRTLRLYRRAGYRQVRAERLTPQLSLVTLAKPAAAGAR